MKLSIASMVAYGARNHPLGHVHSLRTWGASWSWQSDYPSNAPSSEECHSRYLMCAWVSTLQLPALQVWEQTLWRRAGDNRSPVRGQVFRLGHSRTLAGRSRRANQQCRTTVHAGARHCSSRRHHFTITSIERLQLSACVRVQLHVYECTTNTTYVRVIK